MVTAPDVDRHSTRDERGPDAGVEHTRVRDQQVDVQRGPGHTRRRERDTADDGRRNPRGVEDGDDLLGQRHGVRRGGAPVSAL